MTILGNLLDFWQQLVLSKSPTFLGNFCKGVKIYHFSTDIIFRQLLLTFGEFFGHTEEVTYFPRVRDSLSLRRQMSEVILEESYFSCMTMERILRD